MTSIVYKTKDFVVINKPVGMPSQPDPSKDADAMSETSKLLCDVGESNEIYIINRLDRVVGGLMLFARNKKSAADLSAVVSQHAIQKEYFAVVEGELSDGDFVDYIYKDSALSKAFVASKARTGAKRAELSYKVIDTASVNNRKISLVKVMLNTGRFHQIRVQFASRGHALLGDKKYGNKDFGSRFPALFATRLAFSFKGEEVDVAIMPDLNVYPWSLFEKEKYEVK
jgi:23S rRNA pseudouridine1911/1915/1917 synthase